MKNIENIIQPKQVLNLFNTKLMSNRVNIKKYLILQYIPNTNTFSDF